MRSTLVARHVGRHCTKEKSPRFALPGRSVVARGKRITALWIRAWRPASMLRLQCWVMLPTTEGGRGASSHCHVLAWGASHATMGV